jgi:hypothetical protein
MCISFYVHHMKPKIHSHNKFIHYEWHICRPISNYFTFDTNLSNLVTFVFQAYFIIKGFEINSYDKL